MKDHPEPRGEQLTSLLAACDEALAAGMSLAGNRDVPAEFQGRLERGMACMKLLRRMLPQQPTPLPRHSHVHRRAQCGRRHVAEQNVKVWSAPIDPQATVARPPR
jgi:hypothetical protein